MAGGDLLELGHLVGALLVCIGAAGAETAAGRRVQGAGHIALQHDTLGLASRNGVCHRNCGDQAAGVGVDAVGDQLVAVGQFHHLAQIHHADAVGLCGTGTTAKMITDQTGLPVKGYNSGPLGGDQQIGAKIVEGKVDFVIFFSDPLTAAPHDPDVKALLRIAQVYDIPIANNKATADFMIHSELMDEEYNHNVINFNKNIRQRASTIK